MKSTPFSCIFVTVALLPSFARPESTSMDLDEVLRKLEQLETSQKRQVQQMQMELDEVHRELNSARAELNLMKRSAVQNATMYSFSVRLEGNTELDDGPCIFNVVDLNTDNVYNEFSGVFTPPVSGLYQLSVYARSMNSWGPIFIRSNDRTLCSQYIGSGTQTVESMSCTALAELTAGETVRVTGLSSDTVTIQNDNCGFSGQLVQDYP